MAFPRRLFIGTEGTLHAGWKVVLFLAMNGLLSGSVQGLAGFPFLAAWLWTDIAVLLLVSWLLLFLEGRPLGSIGLRPGRRWGTQCLAGMALGLLLMVSISLLIRGLDGFHWVLAQDGGLPSLGSGAWLFLAVALREELLFRGYAFQRLAAGTGDWCALGLASLYFAYGHWHNPGMAGNVRVAALVNLTLAGVLLGLCYLKTRSLAMPIGLHWAWNWTQGSLLGFGVSGISLGSLLEPVFHARSPWLTGGAFGLEASLPCTLLLLLAIGGLALWQPREAP